MKGGSLSSDEKVMIALVRVAEFFKRRSSCIFNYHGLSFSQYNVLRLLETAPAGRLSITEISRRLLVSTPNMSGIAKRLEKSEFATRGSDEHDERKTILEITPKGKKVVSDIRSDQEINVRDFLDCCPDTQRSDMLKMLKKMLELGDYDLRGRLALNSDKKIH